jgi:hypothetical protein
MLSGPLCAGVRTVRLQSILPEKCQKCRLTGIGYLNPRSSYQHLGGQNAKMTVDQHRRIRAERWNETTKSWIRDPKSTDKPRKRPDKAWQILKPNLVDRIGKQKAADVTKRQVVELLEEIVDRGAPVQANRAYGLFKQCFSFAAGKDLISASPMAGIDKPAGNSVPRERALTANEICTFWTKLDDPEIKMEPMLRLALKSYWRPRSAAERSPKPFGRI